MTERKGKEEDKKAGQSLRVPVKTRQPSRMGNEKPPTQRVVSSHHITAQPPPAPPAEALASFFLIFFPDIQLELGAVFPGRSATLSVRAATPDKRCSSTPFLFRLKKPSFFALTVVGKAVVVLPTRLVCRLWPLFGLLMPARRISGLRMLTRRGRASRVRTLPRKISGVRTLPRGTSGAGAGEEGAGGCQAVTGCGTVLIGSRIR